MKGRSIILTALSRQISRPSHFSATSVNAFRSHFDRSRVIKLVILFTCSLSIPAFKDFGSDSFLNFIPRRARDLESRDCVNPVQDICLQIGCFYAASSSPFFPLFFYLCYHFLSLSPSSILRSFTRSITPLLLFARCKREKTKPEPTNG